MPDSSQRAKGTDDLAKNGEPIALSALIEHGVLLEWHEAVAVVRDVCQLLREADPNEPVPDLRHIWICANGRMAIAPGTVGGRTSAEHPVATLGRLLLSLVEDGGIPVQLRIVALSAASATPAYDSVEEFSNALAYFERPSGALPVRPVYTRWHQLAAETNGTGVLEPPPSVPPPADLRPSPSLPSPLCVAPASAPQPSPPPPTPQEVVDLAAPAEALDLFLPEEPEKKVVTIRGRSFPVLPIAVAGAGILGVMLILAWSLSGRSRSSPDAPQVGEAPVGRTTPATITWVSSVAQDVDLDAVGRSAVGGSGTRRAGPTSRVVTTNRLGRAGAGPALPSAQQGNPRTQFAPGTQAGRRTTGLAAPPLRSASRTAGSAAAPPSTRLPAVDERLPVPVGEPADTIYSSADQNVEPPVLVRPRVSVDPPPSGDLEGVSVLDLLIAQTGQVETVKLAAPAQDYREAMIFSAVKTWKFRPGMRDGHPVRYQKRIWIRISPIAQSSGERSREQAPRDHHR